MSLAINSGSEITLIAEGNDEEEALEALINYIQNEN